MPRTNENARQAAFRFAREIGFIASAPATPAELPSPAAAQAAVARRYVHVRTKFAISVLCGLAWAAMSLFAGRVWIEQLSVVVGAPLAWLVIVGIAILPGFMNAFLVASLLLDRRPAVREYPAGLPGVTVLVAAYNEEAHIASTMRQHRAPALCGAVAGHRHQ
jgi:biofilm PGA synthesis N-glycosyltransferase PgaC